MDRQLLDDRFPILLVKKLLPVSLKPNGIFVLFIQFLSPVAHSTLIYTLYMLGSSQKSQLKIKKITCDLTFETNI